MPLVDLLQMVVYVFVIVAAAKPVGTFLYKVFSGERTVPAPSPRCPWNAPSTVLVGVDPAGEMTWVAYAVSVFLFSGVCIVVLYALLRLQGVLPLNPAGVPSMPSLLALNTAVSFVTNTNWQAYAGESGASYLTQMVGSHVAELHLGRSGHRGCRGLRARADAGGAQGDRELLGRPHACVPLRASADGAPSRRRVGLTGRH